MLVAGAGSSRSNADGLGVCLLLATRYITRTMLSSYGHGEAPDTDAGG
jgi:hypothetical protein